MATSAEIIFVGLCSLLNVRNQDTSPDKPPPSAIVMKRANHDTFIAFDTNKVMMTGETATPVSTSSFSAVYFKPEGEELTFNDDRTQLPIVDNSFGDIANFNDYSRISQPKWVEDFIPHRNKLPKKTAVAAYVEFGGGTLAASRLTTVKYQFTPASEPPDPDKAKCFAREVHYTFTTTGDGLLIEARSLDGAGGKRSMLFKPKGNATKVEVWIGSSMDPVSDFKRFETKEHMEGVHFATFYESEQNGVNAAKNPIPRPVLYDCAGNPVNETTQSAPAMKPNRANKPGKVASGNHVANNAVPGEGDPQVGYCGPDSRQ